MSEKSPRFSPYAAVILILALSTALKATWALNSAGSLDVVIFWKFGKFLRQDSLKYMYETYSAFNHTPLTAMIVKTLCRMADGHFFFFAAALRFLSIFADIGLVLGLLHVKRVTGRPPWWAIGLFAISPVSLIISGFHGNMDPVMVMFMFFAGIAVLHGRPALSGALLALAFNIKIVPIVLTPAFFFFWLARGRREALLFTTTTVGGFLLGAAVPLIQCPSAYVAHVLCYSSVWGMWGVTYWVRETGLEMFHTLDFRNLSLEQTAIMASLKAILFGGTMTVSWLRRKAAPVELFSTLGIIWTIVFVFAPGAVVQYMPWFAPFILMLTPRWWAALTAASTIFMVSYYHPAAEYRFPWDLAYPKIEESNPWSNLPWVIFIALLVHQIMRVRAEIRLHQTAPLIGTSPETETAAA